MCQQHSCPQYSFKVFFQHNVICLNIVAQENISEGCHLYFIHIAKGVWCFQYELWEVFPFFPCESPNQDCAADLIGYSLSYLKAYVCEAAYLIVFIPLLHECTIEENYFSVTPFCRDMYMKNHHLGIVRSTEEVVFSGKDHAISSEQVSELFTCISLRVCTTLNMCLWRGSPRLPSDLFFLCQVLQCHML